MSRIGKQPVPVPQNVQVKVQAPTVTVTGPKGSLTLDHHSLVKVAFDDQDRAITVTRGADDRFSRSLHGLTRALLAGMVAGVTEGFEKIVVIEGVGYGAVLQARTLVLNVGFAQPVKMELPQGVDVKLPSPQRVIFSGADKQAVNNFAAQVRSARRADPYHMKGMRYEGEVIRRKVGKAFASGPA